MFKKQIDVEQPKPSKPTVTLADIENAKFEIKLEVKAQRAKWRAIKHRQDTCSHKRQKLGEWRVYHSIDFPACASLTCVICDKQTTIDDHGLYLKLKEKSQ